CRWTNAASIIALVERTAGRGTSREALVKTQNLLIGLLPGLALTGILGTTLFFTAWSAIVSPPFAAEPGLAPSPDSLPEDAETDVLPPLEFFQDVTAQCGVDLTCRNGEEAGHLTLLESLGGGVALFDFDGDGLLDIFLVGGGYFDGPGRRKIR